MRHFMLEDQSIVDMTNLCTCTNFLWKYAYSKNSSTLYWPAAWLCFWPRSRKPQFRAKKDLFLIGLFFGIVLEWSKKRYSFPNDIPYKKLRISQRMFVSLKCDRSLNGSKLALPNLLWIHLTEKVIVFAFSFSFPPSNKILCVQTLVCFGKKWRILL